MKTSTLNQSKILAILRQAEGGIPGPELCREHRAANWIRLKYD
ncbi:hypothetical protein [Brucella pituitosa]|nr:hypothetical protein [Brucella pituitosa]